ncbi:hypothetical protein BH11VER1_BH11VER1_08040 [soil metagenome]
MTAMNLLRLSGVVSCLVLTNCAALFPIDNEETRDHKKGNGYSLDNPPGQSRYMGTPPSDTPDQPPVTPDPNAPALDPNAPAPLPTPPVPNPADLTPPAPVTPRPPVPTQLSYGKMVPGRVGFVYPPGVDAKPENMVDVRGFSPGEKVRDPRTGKVFLVP